MTPCNEHTDCACAEESPFANFSSELPDIPSFFGIGYSRPALPLGTNFGVLTCQNMCESETSQEAADLCAVAQAYLCVTGTWERNGGGAGPGPPVPPPQNPRGGTPVGRFFNSSQSATVFCPDGLPFTFTVPAGRFVDSSQLGANTKAQSYAASQANQFRVCLSEITARTCVNVPYSSSILASGEFVGSAEDIWGITSGALPPGLVITAFGNQAIISGTPTTPGVYTFTVTFQDILGDTMSKPYTIRVIGITTTTLPDGVPFTPYSEFVNATGLTNPIFAIESGTLPAGLVLESASGEIHGTPIQAETQQFVVSVTEAGTGVTCVGPTLEIVITASINFNDITWDAPDLAPSAGGGTASGTSVGNTVSGEASVQAPSPIDNWTSTALFNGTIPYTGDLVACSVNVNITGLNMGGNPNPGDPATQFLVDVVSDIDGILLSLIFEAPEVNDYPFNIPASVGAIITITVQCIANATLGGLSTASNVQGTAIFTPAF